MKSRAGICLAHEMWDSSHIQFHMGCWALLPLQLGLFWTRLILQLGLFWTRDLLGISPMSCLSQESQKVAVFIGSSFVPVTTMDEKVHLVSSEIHVCFSPGLARTDQDFSIQL